MIYFETKKLGEKDEHYLLKTEFKNSGIKISKKDVYFLYLFLKIKYRKINQTKIEKQINKLCK